MTKSVSEILADGRGCDQARELLWQHTVHQVTRLLREAEMRIRSPEGQARYAVLVGWWRASKARLANGVRARVPSETALSEAIVTEVESLQKEMVLKIRSVPEDLVGADGLQFSLEAPRRRKKGIGSRAKPTDIRVYRLGSEVLDLRIEAKCLVRSGDIARSYLAESGLGRFTNPDEPYTDHEVGGMVAYTVCDDRSLWLRRLDEALSGSVPPIRTFRCRLHPSSEDTLFCRVSYSRNGGASTEVAVFHLVLEFDCDPPSR